MFKKFNTKTLLIILVILGGIAAYSKYSSNKNENTFRDEFVKIDTSAVGRGLGPVDRVRRLKLP